MKQRKPNRKEYSFLGSVFLLLAMSVAISAHAHSAFVDKVFITHDTVYVNTGKPLFIVNGVKLPNEIVSALNPSYIKELEVLRGDSARAHYGREGANGVIILTLKTQEEFRAEQSSKRIADFLKTNGAVGSRGVRYYLDGKEVSASAAYEVEIDQMEMKTGADGKLELYIKPVIMIRGDNL